MRSTHVRNPNYWRDGPNFDALEVTAITDPIARVNALIAGDMDLIYTVDSKGVRLIEEADGVRVNSTPSGLYGGICCLKNTEPGSNDDFVMGLRYIQDRERIVRSILKGNGPRWATTTRSRPPTGRTTARSCRSASIDPDKAKFHLNKSGYTSAELFVAPVVSGIEEACLLMQNNLKKIGFDLSRSGRSRRTATGGAVWMKEPLNVVSWNMRPTANSMLAIQFAPGANWNDTFWNNDRMGELLKAQLAETDPDKRHAMLCEMQGLVNTGSGMVNSLPRQHPRRDQRQDPGRAQRPAGRDGRLRMGRVRLDGGPEHRHPGPARRSPRGPFTFGCGGAGSRR